MLSTHRNVLALKFLILFPNLKLSFIVIVIVWLLLTHSYLCSFTKNMIRHAPMGYIRRPSNSGIWDTDATAVIQYINGREPQIHELWCLGLDGISHKVHPTSRVDVIAITVGGFVTDYFAENGRRIKITRKISVNDSIQFLVFLANPGEVGCRLFATFWITLRQQGG